MPYYAKNFYKPEQLNRCIKNYDRLEKFMQQEFTHFDYRPLLNKITCPVLHLAGDLDPVHPYPSAEETASHIKQAQLEIIPGAAAPVYADKPNEVERIIRKFIEKMI